MRLRMEQIKIDIFKRIFRRRGEREVRKKLVVFRFRQFPILSKKFESVALQASSPFDSSREENEDFEKEKRVRFGKCAVLLVDKKQSISQLNKLIVKRKRNKRDEMNRKRKMLLAVKRGKN